MSSASLNVELVGELRDTGKLLVTLVAEINRTVVGHVPSNPVHTADGHIGVNELLDVSLA